MGPGFSAKASATIKVELAVTVGGGGSIFSGKMQAVTKLVKHSRETPNGEVALPVEALSDLRLGHIEASR